MQRKMHTHQNTTQLWPLLIDIRLNCTKIASQTVKCILLGSNHGDGRAFPLEQRVSERQLMRRGV